MVNNLIYALITKGIIYLLIYTGITSTTMNVHLLTHLPFYVRAWGPLWTTSYYCFESANGTLRKFFHGTRNMSKQVTVETNIISVHLCTMI